MARDEKMRLLVFTADWCGVCQAMSKSRAVEQFSAIASDVEVEHVDVPDPEAQHDVADDYAVRSMPTLVFESSDGRELARISGGTTFAGLQKAYQKALGALEQHPKRGKK